MKADDKASFKSFMAILKKKGGHVSMGLHGGIIFFIKGYKPYRYMKGIPDAMIKESNK